MWHYINVFADISEWWADECCFFSICITACLCREFIIVRGDSYIFLRSCEKQQKIKDQGCKAILLDPNCETCSNFLPAKKWGGSNVKKWFCYFFTQVLCKGFVGICRDLSGFVGFFIVPDKSRQIPTNPDRSRQIPTDPDKSRQIATNHNKILCFFWFLLV